MRITYLISALLLPLNLIAQEPKQNTNQLHIWEAGLPFITNYTPGDYKASVQNWCFIQDNRGVMYIGNTLGILEYDGVSWDLIKLSNSSLVRSFAKDSRGRIYVGGVRDFGYLEPDSIGQIQFQSLLPELEPKYHNFADVWCTLASASEIFFISYDYIFKWDGTKIKVWESEYRFGNASLINNELYVEIPGIGIMKLMNDSLKVVPGGAQFINKKGIIRTMLPFDGNKILLVHSNEGLFLYDHREITPYRKGNVNLLKNKGIYNVITLPNGDYLAISIRNGIYIFDSNGRIKQHLNRKRGLISDVVYGVFVDKEGTVWLGTNNGISKVEISSPLRIFNNLSGLTDRIENVCYHSGRFYVCTSKKLFYLKEPSFEGDNNDIFQEVFGIEARIRSLISADKDLLVIAQDNVYRVDENNKVYPIKWNRGMAISALRSEIDSNKVYVGSSDGRLLVMHLDEWELNHKLTIDGEIHSIQENPDGSLWLSTLYNGVYKVDGKTNGTSDFKIIAYDTLAGLPDMSFNFIYQSRDKTYVTTYDSIFYFDIAHQTFKPDTLLLSQFDKDVDAYGFMFFEKPGSIWQTVKAGIENRIYYTDNNILEELKYSRRFTGFETYTINKVKDLLLFAGPKGIVLYNPGLDNKNIMRPEVIIRKVLAKNDSLIFAGQSINENTTAIELPFQNSALRFIYALPYYDNPERNLYQYFLEGFDKDWSTWSTETQRDFTNLPEGDYRFRVRGQNVYGQTSEEAVYAFTILPPWHRTWWAYLLYVLTGAGMIVLIVRWRFNQLRREKVALENIVTERTQQLAHQAEQLKEMDKMKSRLFANISHEFRTPLTLIKGPIAELLKTQKENLRMSDAQMIDRNTDRLLRLVNQLLDLSKLDSGNLHLELKTGDVYQFLRAVAAAFSSHAEQRRMRYQIEIPRDVQYASFDHDKLEKIVYNLLSNAFKFTPDDGEVTIKSHFKNNQLILNVIDNGQGVSSELLPHIFDRFYQADSSATREHEGAGIGLALTKELVTLMKGNISVKSPANKTGSIFTVTIPITSVDVDEKVTGYEATITTHMSTDKVSEQATLHGDLPQLQEAPIVLIVEDNADMRNFIKEQLCDDYQILEASNGKEGLILACEKIPDLVITDLMMPQMDGVELCKKLKTDERISHIPVIMLTAKAGQKQKIEGLETGADDYLTKPFDKKELQVRVKNLITQRQQLRERFSQEILLEPKKIAITSMDEQFLQKVMDRLEENLSDISFGVPQLQDMIAMSKTQLFRKIKALTDQSPGEFMRNYRLKRAAQILAQHGENVTQAAYTVGFNNLSYFAKCFKELYGVAPSEYTGQSIS